MNLLFKQKSMLARQAGFTLIECLLAITILVVAISAMLHMYITSVHSERFAEERRIAIQAAEEQIDKLRAFANSGASLDNIYAGNYPYGSPLVPPYQYPNQYPYTSLPLRAMPQPPAIAGGAETWYLAQSGTQPNLWPVLGTPPVTDPNNMPVAAFKVPGLMTNSGDPLRQEYVGTVSLINDEQPNEANFGLDFSYATPKWLGVDINGNGLLNNALPSPFSASLPGVDLNENGLINEVNVTSSFRVLPVVVTVHWYGVFGPKRVDLFTMIFTDKVQ